MMTDGFLPLDGGGEVGVRHYTRDSVGIVERIKLLLRRGPKQEPQSPEDLRLAFRGRYHLFKLLLNANNKALDIMTEMEEALKGTWPFGMSFVRSRCTSVSTSVFQIVKNLNDLAPGKYGALFSRFKEIQMKVNPFISPKMLSRDGALVKPLREVDKSMADLVGSKMANLAEIGRQVDFRIPGRICHHRDWVRSFYEAQ